MKSPGSYPIVSTGHLRLISTPCVSRDFFKSKMCKCVFISMFHSVKHVRPESSGSIPKGLRWAPGLRTQNSWSRGSRANIFRAPCSAAK